MMKLYFSRGACSLSVHIALREIGSKFDLVQVDTQAKQTKSGQDYRSVNPKGYVPALELDDGQVLTEAAVILQYLADKNPNAKLAPPAGTMERYRLQEWLNFVATEIHKGISPLWSPKTPPEARGAVVERLNTRLEFLDRSLEGRQFLAGDAFSIADAYLFTVARWTKPLQIDISSFKHLVQYIERIGARPAVKAAIDAEKN
jgi:glutathione S-transferase